MIELIVLEQIGLLRAKQLRLKQNGFAPKERSQGIVLSGWFFSADARQRYTPMTMFCHWRAKIDL